MGSTIDGDLRVLGHIYGNSMTVAAGSVTNTSVASGADIDPEKMAQVELAQFVQKLTDLRIWDAFQTTLPGTSSSDDLGLYGGTFGSASPEVKTADLKAAGATNVRARLVITLPANYDPGHTVTLRLFAGMETTISDGSATIDVEAYLCGGDGSVGSDLCATAAQSINSLTEANKDFTITPTGLVAGDQLDVRITIAVNDAGTGTAVIATLGKIALLCDTRG